MKNEGVSAEKIRVLVVDDSAFMRVLISDMLSSDDEIEVVGVARDGEEAVKKALSLHPDVITMDVDMPKMDGITAVERIMEKEPIPVVMLSGYTKRNAKITIKALERGAFDFVAKPSGELSLDIDKVRSEIITKIKNAFLVRDNISLFIERRRRRLRHAGADISVSTGMSERPAVRTENEISEKVVVIGASTGGPSAISEVISHIPADIHAGILIVQHMPAGFTKSFAERLNEIAEINVKEGTYDDVIRDGCAIVAPGGYHMVVKDRGKVGLSKRPPVNAVRPSVDVTMISASAVYGAKTIGVVLTGMGRDGADGVRKVKERGGMTIACDESTSLIFGMPKAAIETGCVDEILPLHAIGRAIVRAVERVGS
ncbi:chemotaxis response regulator protein-glutamate methylesterase [Methanosarcinales archaeon]|nr:MAG: chemotaxis response regulator protein-glutamate methylesterase [Methanosarcinales archaeon]